MVRRRANILGASKSSGAVLEKALVQSKLICNGLAVRGRQNREKDFLQRLTPPSDHINSYFEKKSGQPEWPRRTLQSCSGKFFDSPYRLCPCYREFSKIVGENLVKLKTSFSVFEEL
jgi:hypothetical protein